MKERFFLVFCRYGDIEGVYSISSTEYPNIKDVIVSLYSEYGYSIAKEKNIKPIITNIIELSKDDYNSFNS